VRTFKVSPSILVGYTLLVFSYTAFFLRLIMVYGKLSLGSLLIAVLVVPVILYYVSLLVKRVDVDDDGISSRGILGRKTFRWEDIGSVNVSGGRRRFLFLTSKDGAVMMVDDSISGFREILRLVGERVNRSLLPEDWDRILSCRRSNFNLVLIYVASLLLLFVVFKSFAG